MSLTFRWVGEADFDRLAEVRTRCYAAAWKDLPDFQRGLRTDGRAQPGDYLLAERDGEALGTATSLSFTMWVRGAPLACQGVAFVGTAKNARRAGSGAQRGVASQILHECIRLGRERQQVLSALMPFRVSYYEHFGYGIIDRRVEWNIPLSILPNGDCDGFHYQRDEDLPELMACRQRSVEAGQCDMERSAAAWKYLNAYSNDGYCMIDRPQRDGPVRSHMFIGEYSKDERKYVQVVNSFADSPEGLIRQLRFLGSLKDQYSFAVIQLPADLPLLWLLREGQLPHRPVDHPVAKSRPLNRLQVRILDHKRFLEALRLPTEFKDSCVVSIKECEGNESRFRIDLAEGRCSVTASHEAEDIIIADRVWAPIACGDLSATLAAKWGLIDVKNAKALKLLDVLSMGQAPWCNERF